MKNQKGITLIALVITIIVLLILAGVSVAMLAGPNGIITQANQAADDNDTAEIAERINLELNAIYASILSGAKVDSTYMATISANLPDGYKITYSGDSNQDNGIITITNTAQVVSGKIEGLKVGTAEPTSETEIGTATFESSDATSIALATIEVSQPEV